LEFQIPVENGAYTIFTLHNELWFGQAGLASKSWKKGFLTLPYKAKF